MHPERFQVEHIPYRLSLEEDYRLTVDTDDDYCLAQQVYDALYEGEPIANEQVYDWLAAHPAVSHLNAAVDQKESDLIANR